MADLRCVIVDDEPLARQVLLKYVEETPGLLVAGECRSCSELLGWLEENQADLVFLDIEMPGISGIELLESAIMEVPVVLTTAYSEFAVKGFDLNAADYLLKPFSYARFLSAIKKLKDKTKIKPSSLMLRAEGRVYRVNPGEVLFVEAMGDYVRVHLINEVITAYITLKTLIHKCGGAIEQVHRSFAVNFEFMEYLEGNRIKIKDHEVPIGASYKESIIKKLEGGNT